MQLVPTLIGLAAGLGLSVFANLFILPMVLRSQRDRGRDKVTTPIGEHSIERFTRFMYRYQMPVIFSIVFIYAAHKMGLGLS